MKTIQGDPNLSKFQRHYLKKKEKDPVKLREEEKLRKRKYRAEKKHKE